MLDENLWDSKIIVYKGLELPIISHQLINRKIIRFNTLKSIYLYIDNNIHANRTKIQSGIMLFIKEMVT